VRAVAQRVSHAVVRVQGEEVASVDAGLLALVGVAEGDTEEDAAILADKLVHLRIFQDDAEKMNRSLLDTGGSLAVVSQFTLLGDCRKGRRPSFARAAAPEAADALIDVLMQQARNLGVPVASGRFGARMQVELTNEGPVTLLLDTRREF
jgi:D-tyrosyl-tRNA(Tyr) deacylase